MAMWLSSISGVPGTQLQLPVAASTSQPWVSSHSLTCQYLITATGHKGRGARAFAGFQERQHACQWDHRLKSLTPKAAWRWVGKTGHVLLWVCLKMSPCPLRHQHGHFCSIDVLGYGWLAFDLFFSGLHTRWKLYQ